MATKSTNETYVALLVKQASIPKNANIIRIAGSGNSRPSAVAPPFLKPVLNWSTPPALAQQVLPGDEAIVIVTNDPLCAMIFTDKNPTAVPLSQRWLYGGSPDSPLITLTAGQTKTLVDDLFCSVPDAGFRAWHGPRLYARKFKGKYYVFCDASTTPGALNIINLNTFGVAMAATDSVTWSIYRLQEGDDLEVTSLVVTGPVIASATAATAQLPAPDYYRCELSADDDNTTALLQFNINNQASSEIEVHLALPDLSERQLNIIQGIRVPGASSHCMNLVSDQNATGSWAGDQPEGGVIWTSYIRGVTGANGLQKITAQQGNELMELKKYNPYTFVTPEDDDDWKFTHPFTFNPTGQVTNTLNRSMEEFHYTVVYLKSGGATAAVADASRNIQMEFYFAVEYTSDSLWPMPGISPATQDDVQAAVKILASMENITHNPAFKDILATIGKYARLSAPVLSLLGPYGKAAGLAVGGVGAGLGKLGYRTRQRAKAEGHVVEGGQRKSARLAQIAPVDDTVEVHLGPDNMVE